MKKACLTDTIFRNFLWLPWVHEWLDAGGRDSHYVRLCRVDLLQRDYETIGTSHCEFQESECPCEKEEEEANKASQTSGSKTARTTHSRARGVLAMEKESSSGRFSEQH
jgi:hypothetical protein